MRLSMVTLSRLKTNLGDYLFKPDVTALLITTFHARYSASWYPVIFATARFDEKLEGGLNSTCALDLY